MSDQTDFQLLQEYFDHQSQPAFAELVRRYIDLVYSSAMRQVRDPHAAEDVTQTVFIVLAQKGRQIRARAVVAGWLLGVTRFAARDHLKRTRRRRHYEHAAALERTAAMVSAQNDDSSNCNMTAASDVHTQAQLARVLDDALAKLGGSARDAMILRFFENQSFKQVGDRLGITELAARQRVFRSLERLRNLLAHRGLALGSESLAVALAATAVISAPASLSAAVAATATSAGAAAPYAALLKGTVTLMKFSKAKSTVLTALLLLLIAVSAGLIAINWPKKEPRSVVVSQSSTTRSNLNSNPSQNTPSLRDIIPPENFAPPSFGWRTRAPWETPMPANAATPYLGPPITGTVLSPDGQPLAGAQVLLLIPNTAVPQEIRRGARVAFGVNTLANGGFAFRPPRQPVGLFVKSPEGCAWIPADSIKPDQSITLARWGRLEVTVRRGDQPVNQAGVTVSPAADAFALGNPSVLTDQDGRAIIEQVPPGETRVEWIPNTAARQRQAASTKPPLPPREIRVNVGAGETKKLAFGGGRPVIGVIDGDLRDFDHRGGVLRSTENLSIYFDARFDGSFIVTDVPPGDYELAIDLGVTWGKNIKSIENYAVARANFKMPPVPGGFSEEPLDIGKVHMIEKKILEVGQPFPKVAGKTPKGESISIDHFHGKILLLEVAAQPDSRSRGEIEWQHSVRGHFGANPSFAMLTMTANATSAQAPSAAAPWPHMQVERLPAELEGSSRSMYLLDAEGTLVAKNITAAQAYAVLDKALQSTPDPRVKFDYVERLAARANPPYQNIPAPSADDAAAGASVSLVAGVPSWDTPKSDVNVLTDGKMLSNEDAPAEALFFQAGSLEGRFRIDLKEPTNVAEIRTYSWHKDTRGAQVFRVFASDGAADNFNLAPGIGIDPTQCGWKSIAFVDTRPEMKPVGVQDVAEGGRYVSSIADKEKGSLGIYRHLLFQVFVTEADDVFGHTFYGEIDVIPVAPSVPDTKAASASQKSTGP